MKQVILIGGGTTLKEGIDKDLWNKIKDKEVWSLNYAFKTMPYLPKREIWVDKAFFTDNVEDLQTLCEKGVQMITRQNIATAFIEKIIQYPSTRERKDYRGKQGLEKSPLIFIGQQGLVGIFALSLAIAERYDEIFLLGYNYGVSDIKQKKTHYYQDYLKVQSSGMGRPEVYLMPNGKVRKEIRDFEPFSKEEGIKIWNVSLTSNIPYFERISYENFFKKLEEND